MQLLPVSQRCDQTHLGNAIRSSQWLFPRSISLCSPSLAGQSYLWLFVVSASQLQSQLMRDLTRGRSAWVVGSLLVMLTTGTLLFLAESVKCYYGNPFRRRMTWLLLAIIPTFTVGNVHYDNEKFRQLIRMGQPLGRVIRLPLGAISSTRLS